MRPAISKMTRRNLQKTKKGKRKYTIMRNLAGDVRQVDNHNFLDINGLHYTLMGNKSGSFDLYVGMVGDETKPYHLSVNESDLEGAVRRLTSLKAREWGIFPDTSYVHPVLLELGMKPITKLIRVDETKVEETESKAKQTAPSSSGVLKYVFGAAASLAAVVVIAYALSGSPKTERGIGDHRNYTFTQVPEERPQYDLNIFGITK